MKGLNRILMKDYIWNMFWMVNLLNVLHDLVSVKVAL